ncbi:NAD(FAD)-utilizing dehydrogenase [Candidatus Paraburkholderia calva]|nr:NAD(FAD)-utilizing dehydrogenase [Candidatus Paraburkholderia calva]
MRAMEYFDIAVIGAGAAGMMCTSVATQSVRRVVLIDHAERPAEKIRIPGGGRCNFTNINAQPANFLSANPYFCRSALARYTPRDFLALLKSYRVKWHEKHKGQLFCDDSSETIIDVLKSECDAGGVTWRRPVAVHEIRHADARFSLDTGAGTIDAKALVIATGGLSIPKTVATDLGYRVAKQFGHRLVDTRPALVPLTFTSADWTPFAVLSGLSLPVRISTGQGKTRGEFDEDLLLTHRGVSGPGVLQISSYWNMSEPIRIDLLPDATELLIDAKAGSKKQIGTVLAEHVPTRLAHAWLEAQHVSVDARLADLPDRTLKVLGASLSGWTLTPSGTEGYRKAEVTRGGVYTRELSFGTVMSECVAGLYFVGEAVDVTGWLGGYNFQWAWPPPNSRMRL